MPTQRDDMTLEEFIAEEKARIDAFANHWRQMQAADGKEIWPDQMPGGEWGEQLLAFEG